MRAWTRLACIAVLAVTLGGCLVAEDSIILRPDGSGSILARHKVDLNGLTAFRVALLQRYPTLLGPEFGSENPSSKAWLEHLGKPVEGSTLVSVEEKLEGSRRVTEVQSRFTTLQDAAKAGVLPGVGVELARSGATWKLTLVDAFLERDTISGFDPKQAIVMLAVSLQHMKLTRKLRLPSRIVDSNGVVAADRRSVEWTWSFAEVVNGFAKANLHMWVTFEHADELKLEPFAVPADRKRLVRRMGQQPPGSDQDPEKQRLLAEITIARITLAALRYRIEHGYEPEALEDLLEANRKNNFMPYLAELPVDPWGNAYRIVRPEDALGHIASNGPDGEPDTDDDMTKRISQNMAELMDGLGDD